MEEGPPPARRARGPGGVAGPGALPVPGVKRATAPEVSSSGAENLAEAWFAARGWQAFAFQREVWAAMAAGQSGLLHATTGSGKTYAVWFGALARADVILSEAKDLVAASGRGSSLRSERQAPPLGVLWLTPMRALAADSARAMKAPLDELGLSWSIGIRTGDTAAAERAKQDRRFPTALVTTPESLSLMLTRDGARTSSPASTP